MAQEVLNDLDNKSTATLNDELRKSRRDVRTINSQIELIEPSGIIVMWHGSVATIPSGWYLCDGNNGTPDLRDRFIVGAKQDDSGVAKTNLTGALTQSGNSNIAAHTHDILGGTSISPAGGYAQHATGASGGDFTSSSYGSGTETYPRYYALCFIMKA